MAATSKKTTSSSAGSTPAKKPAIKKIADKAPAKKSAAKKVEAAPAVARAPKKRIAKNNITPEDRNHMIATAAYFNAEQRGFAAGHEMHDWFTGERQIDALLNSSN